MHDIKKFQFPNFYLMQIIITLNLMIQKFHKFCSSLKSKVVMAYFIFLLLRPCRNRREPKVVFPNRCPVVPLSQDKKKSCPAVPLSRDKGKSKNPQTNSSVPGCPGTRLISIHLIVPKHFQKKWLGFLFLEHPFLFCPFFVPWDGTGCQNLVSEAFKIVSR